MSMTADELKALNAKIDTMLSQRANPERHTPYGTTGIAPDSQPFSFLKAGALAIGAIPMDKAKVEKDVSDRLVNFYEKYGYARHQPNSICMPTSTAFIPQMEPEGRKLAIELGQMNKSWGPPDPDEWQYLQNRFNKAAATPAIGTVSDISGGTLVAPPVLGEFIDLQRNLEVFPNAGATEVPLSPNGRMLLPKLTGGATAFFVGEALSIANSAQSTGSLLLEGKKLGVLVPINNELLRFASPAAEAMIRVDMARVAAIRADLAMLEGSGGVQIKGLIQYDTADPKDPLNSYAATTQAANGNTFSPIDVANMEGVLPDAVQDGLSWVMRRNFYAVLYNRRADAVVANDAAGGFMFWIDRGESGRANERQLYGAKVVRSTQVSNTRVKGAGTNLTYVILGYFPDWVIARHGIMEFLMANQSDTALVNDQTFLRAIQTLDAGPRHPRSFVLCDQLLIA